MKVLPLVFLLVLGISGVDLRSQTLLHEPGALLVRLDDGQHPLPLITRLQEDQPDMLLSNIELASRALNVWLLQTDPSLETNLLEWINKQPEVLTAQYNHLLEYRGRIGEGGLLPNDPLFTQQWYFLNTGAQGGIPDADLDAEQAWAITTGGLTVAGDTIVLAIIDSGFDYTHEDLSSNLWRNHQEIQGDHLDNDGNGYVDDYYGWNVYEENDDIGGVSTAHGTPVAAVVGARGDNSIGVTGVNWQTKLLCVAGNNTESAILKSYDYVWMARKRYNESNGQDGAFIVAVNCSWGLTYGQPSDAPLWCAAFDTLGAVGILSIAATANVPVDVDIAGDLPTACNSPYLVTVTSLDRWDNKAGNAAWGLKTIDLGSYGEDIFSAGTNNTYGHFYGTSFAAPQVTGAVGLLYAAPCPNLLEIAQIHPPTAAALVKNRILYSVTPNTSLLGRTVSNGRLNLEKLVGDYEDQCTDCIPPFALMAQEATENSLLMHWLTTLGMQSISLRWRKAGTFFWSQYNNVTLPFELQNLQGCTGYEFSIRGVCPNGKTSTWSTPVVVQTTGCCYPPEDIQALDITETSALLSWSSQSHTTNFEVWIRDADSSYLETYWCTQTSKVITGLEPCTTYLVEIAAQCTADSLSLPRTFQFRTNGCGSCTDLNYCGSEANSAKDEWIKLVMLGAWTHASDGHEGFEDFTGDLGSLPALQPLMPQTVTITPAFSGLPYKEFFRVYIDFNADGDFDDDHELAFDPGFASESTVSGVISLPDDFVPGVTRMRISMKYRSLNGLPPNPCESFDFGQVEDYCIQLGPSTSSSIKKTTPVESEAIWYPQPVSNWMEVRLPEAVHGKFKLRIFTPAGAGVLDSSGYYAGRKPIRVDLPDLPAGPYFALLFIDGQVYRHKLLILR
ncbi:MAG: hypothetical protein EP344_16035 [Bacteroidetes bacterium]|nr:MAG: hypothetical protein EP344_16035 [Bacteroidota bacterium]